MNKGLVVNSEPLARVWSPLLAIVLLVLLFPALSLKTIVRMSLSAAVRRRAEPAAFENGEFKGW